MTKTYGKMNSDITSNGYLLIYVNDITGLSRKIVYHMRWKSLPKVNLTFTCIVYACWLPLVLVQLSFWNKLVKEPRTVCYILQL